MRAFAVVCMALGLAGCQTINPVTRKVDPETLPSCTRACQQVGMRLTGIVFVSEFGGCVCEPEAATGGDRSGAAPSAVTGRSAALSGALVVIQAAQDRQDQEGSAHGAAHGH